MNWKIIENRLTKVYTCKSFSDIIEKLNELSDHADKVNHHPDFTVFDYKKIRFELWTHDKNAVTAADYKMAEFIQVLFQEEVS